MSAIRYNGVVYQCNPDETLLKMFLRNGVTVPYSCGGGSCHVCMHRCIEGDIPERAQRGLSPILRENRFILLCRCTPSGDMEVELPPVVGGVVETQKPMNEVAITVDMPEGINRPFPEPDAALWQDLQQGDLLARLLKVFYSRVFADLLLAPYFEGVTQARLAEKQYNFLRQAITGEKVYFGERPRNSHHWMVIPDNVFDRRADILRDVIREFDLPQAVGERLMAIEEGYRQDIVKRRPWNKVLFGRVLPLEGYESLVLDEGCLCDGCEKAIESGDVAIYHVRTGKLYCNTCRAV